MRWKLSHKERQTRIEKALEENVNFCLDTSLGYPASKLDSKVYNEEASYLADAPTLKTFVANPNHIGCHAQGSFENKMVTIHGIKL